MTRGFCSIADSACIAPAGWASGSGYAENHGPRARAGCTECGCDVCGNCSTLRTVRGARVRLCNDCAIMHDGSEKLVMRRIERLVNKPPRYARNS